MSISLVGTATGTTTCTVPAHVARDLIVIAAYQSGSTTAPSLGSGYTSVLTKSGTTCSMRVGYKIATSTSDASGTWTNATALVCHVYSISSGVLAIGASASSSSTTNTVSYPALTLRDTSGNSWVLGFAGVNNLTETISTAPAGMTNESLETASASQAAGHDTEGGVSSWSAANATTTGTAGDSVSATVELLALSTGSVPSQMVQHVGGGGNPYTRGNTGNAFKLPFPNATGAGNCLVLGFTCDAGATVSSVSDNINGTWPAATASSSGGAGNLDSYVYVFPNSASGQVKITVTFGASVRVFGSCMTEFYGVATSSPVSAHSSAAYSTTVATGSFTPGSNNSIIWAYFCKAEGSGIPAQLVSQILPGANFTLLDADIGWFNANDSLTHASEIYAQTTAAAINPGLTVTTQSTDHWNSLGIALTTSGGAGTAPPAGIRIVKVLHFATEHFATNYPLQIPSIGNLRLLCSDDPSLNNQTIVDNEGNTWSGSGTTGIASGTGLFYQANAQANSNLAITLTGGGGDATLSWRYCDIIGAATSPYDSAVAVTDTLNSVSSFTPTNLPAPTSSSGLTIANIGLGQGPGLAVTAPSGAVWDLALYTGETDFDLIENADIMAHHAYSASGSQTWTFTITNQAANSDSGGFISFKAPSGTTVSIAGAGSIFAAGAFSPGDSFSATGIGSLYAAGALTVPSGTTVALSNVGSLYSAGAFGEAESGALAGYGTPFAAGTLAAAVSEGPSGAGSLYEAGTLARSASAGVTGAGTHSAAGLLFSVEGSSLDGFGSPFSAGSFSILIAAALAGTGSLFAAATTTSQTTFLPFLTMGSPFAAGSFTPSSGGSVALIGSGSLFAAGALAVSISDAELLAGTGSLFSAGSFSVSGGGAVSLAGAGSLFSSGALGVIVSDAEALAGLGSLFSAGAVAPASSRSISGVGTVYASGAFGVTVSDAKALGGVGSLFGAGALTPTGGGNVPLAAIGSLFSAGSFALSIADTEALAGIGSLFGAGSFAVGGFRTAVGVGTPYASGSFAKGLSAAILGAGSAYSAGATAAALARAFSGSGSLFAAGTIAALPGRVVPLIGAGSAFSAGVLALSVSDLVALIGVGTPVHAGALGPVVLLEGASIGFAAGTVVAIPVSGLIVAIDPELYLKAPAMLRALAAFKTALNFKA